MFFVWGVVARLLEKKSRPFLIKQSRVSVEFVCVVVKNLIVVCKKEEENFFSCFFKTKTKKEDKKKAEERLFVLQNHFEND